MNELKETKNSLWTDVGRSIYIVVAMNILPQILKSVFSLSTSTAFGIALLFTFLTFYPLFVRGTVNIWTKDKRQWTFLPWIIVSVIFSVSVYFAGQYFF